MAQKSAQEYQNKRVITLFVAVHCKRVRNLLKQKHLEEAFVAQEQRMRKRLKIKVSGGTAPKKEKRQPGCRIPNTCLPD